MEECEVEVVQIAYALRPDGSKAIQVIFGTPFMNPEMGEKARGQTVKVQLPGQVQPNYQYENRIVLFLTPQEWETIKIKPTMGSKYWFSFNGSVQIRRAVKK